MPSRTLTVMPVAKGTVALQAVRAVLYVRVSSKDQEKEGFSIPAQRRVLREYATSRGLVITQEFEDVETAKSSGRTGFNQMLAYLARHQRACRTILVEKTDRLYRNLKDWVTLDGLDLEIHFVKENAIVSPNSRSSEKLMHGMKVLMARNYIDNLSEETRKGMTEKARAGIYPSYAPVGYRNTDSPDGKRVIISDPNTAPLITELFGRFATGRYSLKALVRELNREGFKLRGRDLHSSVVHQILRKRLYSGDFDWDGTRYEGLHEPLVTRECIAASRWRSRSSMSACLRPSNDFCSVRNRSTSSLGLRSTSSFGFSSGMALYFKGIPLQRHRRGTVVRHLPYKR